MLLLCFISVLCAIIFILFRYSFWRQKCSQLIPGNNIGLFNVFGDLKEVLIFWTSNFKHDIHHYVVFLLMKWVEQHKKEKLFCIWFFYDPFVFLIKADAVRELLKERKIIERNWVFDKMKILLGEGLVTRPIDKWKPRRKLLMPCFSHAMLREYLTVMNKHSKEFVKFLEKETKQESFVAKKYFTHLSLDIICDTMFGFSTRSVETDDPKYVTAVTRLEDIFLSRVYKFWLWSDFIFKFTSEYREGMQYIRLLQDLANSVFEEKKILYLDKSKTNLKGKRKAMIDVLLQLHLETKELSKDDVMDELMTFLFAGLERTAAALMWAFFMIGLHPEVQQKIQEELDNVFGEDRERYATEDDLNDLTYLSCVLKKIPKLIYTPVIIISLSRKTLSDIVRDYLH
ncbi:cytochrome P450 4V2 [Nephila pilipes]|uniref:Cytochrome P450 4V2 n=1 Tax=Nephila pilipes TaxID=299642 RepID=A0A8X6NG02_NEPPI|nr:cytochrome P450 4V2 [Nephila pilipes]